MSSTITLTRKQADLIWEALLDGHSLADDLVALERAEIKTWFKKGVPAKMERRTKKAFDLLDGKMRAAA